MKILRNVVGALLCLTGIVWFCQGIGLLPGSFIGVETVLYAPISYRAWVRMTEHANSQIGLGRAPTEPRARLAALLRAYAETTGG